MARYELVPDSGGSGEFWGGLGLLREYEMLAESATVNVRGDRAVFAPRGLYGGGNGSFATLFLEREGGGMEKIPSKYGSHIKRSQHLKIMTPGGGFGEPPQRERTALVRDFLDGKVSAEKIKQDYGVDIRAAVQAAPA